MSAPTSHLEESQKLTADGLVNLYQITLKSSTTIFRFCDSKTVTWQTHEYEGLACKLTGDDRNSDGEETRATLVIMNPEGIFNQPAMQLQLDLATVIRKRVLYSDLIADAAIFQQRMWYVGRVPQLIHGQSITLELRNMTEGANFQIPRRQYIPPEFPLVSL